VQGLLTINGNFALDQFDVTDPDVVSKVGTGATGLGLVLSVSGPPTGTDALQGVKKYPARVKCALLPWTTLRETVDLYRHREPS